ncbi:UNVERIFIED_CONTAM: hypothetical protein FKN15_017021 [Acipenser sinensis]
MGERDTAGHMIYRTEHLSVRGGTCGHEHSSPQSGSNTMDIAHLINPLHQRGEKQKAKRKNNPWNPVGLNEFYTFLAIILFMGIVRLPSVKDYWTGNDYFGMLFCKQFMSGNRFLAIMWNLCMSNPQDEQNDRRKGTAEYD